MAEGKNAFDVDLSALLRVFGGHLYSTPAVFVRELVQNALDAIALRRAAGDDFAATIEVSLDPDNNTIVFTDNGIGLDRDGLRTHLSRVGGSSKRQADRSAVIGQFGIGLLSGFLVADELVVHTKKQDGPALCWSAAADGSYTVTDGRRHAPGTEVIVTLRKDAFEFADVERLRELLRTYVRHVDTAITLTSPHTKPQVVTSPGIWDLPGEEIRAEIMTLTDENPLATLAVDSEGNNGVLWFRPENSTMGTPTLALYHHGVLVHASVGGLLPQWAGFVSGIINANALAPTASRESFVTDGAWHSLRQHVTQVLLEFLRSLPQRDPELLFKIFVHHGVHIRAACIEDEALMAACGEQMPFETNQGMTRIADLDEPHVIYTTSQQEFSQMAPLLASHGAIVFNACHVHEEAFLRAWQRYSGGELEEMQVPDLRDWVEDAPEHEARFAPLLAACQKLLAPYDVEPYLKRFSPAEVPVMLLADESQLRERAKSLASEGNPLQRALVKGLSVTQQKGHTPLLINVDNPLLSSLPEAVDITIGARVVRMLYMQAASRVRRVPSLLENRVMGEDLMSILRAVIPATETVGSGLPN